MMIWDRVRTGPLKGGGRGVFGKHDVGASMATGVADIEVGCIGVCC